MKNLALKMFLLVASSLCAQEQPEAVACENYGGTFNSSVGYAYYRYVGHHVPVFHADLELQIDRNLTAAPFIEMYEYHGSHFWGNVNNEFRTYSYTQKVIPAGIKLTYYFDELLKAGTNWDFYAGGSLGYAWRQTTWDEYYSGTDIRPGFGSLYLNVHAGVECHLTRMLGIQLDVTPAMSTIGIALHI